MNAKFAALLLAALLCFATRAAAEQHPLTHDAHGVKGALEVVADQRIEPRNRRALQDWYMFGFNDPPPVRPPVTEQALAEAELRLLDERGRTLWRQPLGTPFATLAAVALLGSRPTEFVLETAQGGFGQFTGTTARPLVVDKGTVRFLAADGEDIVLLRAPKTDWRIVPARAEGGEMLQVLCRPGEGGADSFGEVYLSWRREAGQWRRRSRNGRGYCAWADGFPPLAAFP